MSARLMRDQLHRYTAALLPYALGNGAGLSPLVSAPDKEDAWLRQALRAAERGGREHFLLLGVGDGRLPDALAEALPASVIMTVLELQPERVRAAMREGRLGWWREAGRHRLVADTSPWALLVLLVQAGVVSSDAGMMLHPALKEAEREAFRRWQRVFSGAVLRGGAADTDSDVSTAAAKAAALTVGVITHAEEPRLDDFFASVPSWVHEVLVVWDAPGVPAAADRLSRGCPARVRHHARLLDGDFGAQRNCVLEQCATEWLLFLDGDERFAPQAWSSLPSLMHSSLGAVGFPRWTRMGTEQACRAGFGLWPDTQVRLLRLGAGLRFVNRVHEQAVGLAGPLALAMGMHMDHYSHVWKDADALADKLRVFDAAAGRQSMHRLNEEYPAVDCALLALLEQRCGIADCLVLPPDVLR